MPRRWMNWHCRTVSAGSVRSRCRSARCPVTDLFTDAWDYFTKKHPVLEGSQLKLETIPAVTYCDGCGKTYETVTYGRTCPYCKSTETWLVQGNECIIKEIEAETAEETGG